MGGSGRRDAGRRDDRERAARTPGPVPHEAGGRGRGRHAVKRRRVACPAARTATCPRLRHAPVPRDRHRFPADPPGDARRRGRDEHRDGERLRGPVHLHRRAPADGGGHQPGGTSRGDPGRPAAVCRPGPGAGHPRRGCPRDRRARGGRRHRGCRRLPHRPRIRGLRTQAGFAGSRGSSRRGSGRDPGPGGASLIPELPPPPPGAPAHGPGDLPAVRWGAWEAIGVFFVGNLVIAQVVVGTIVLAVMGVGSGQPIEGLPQIVATVAADVAFLGAMLVWLTWKARDWRRLVGIAFGAKGVRDAAVGFGLGALLYVVVGVVVAVPLLAIFRRVFGGDVAPPEQIPGSLSINAKLLTAFLALVLAPITEELFYRGIFYRSLRDRHGVLVGAVVSAVLFGASHV